MHLGLLFFLPFYREKINIPSLRKASWYVESASFLFTGLGLSLGLDFAHAISLNLYF